MFSAAGDYDRFMGRYSMLLAPQMADLANVKAGQHVLDVGCGPGALTGELVRRVGAANVSAVDPSEPFIAAVRARYPGVAAGVAPAEALPFTNGSFDAAIAQLVVHFMKDPVGGVREMARVTKTGGAVAACVWDNAGETGPLGAFWQYAHEIDPNFEGQDKRVGTKEGDLIRVFEEAGLRDVTGTMVVARITLPSFDAWWQPFELGVGPAGALVAKLEPAHRVQLRDRLREAMPKGDFHQDARAWAARGTV